MPRFKRLRDDKPPKECTVDQIVEKKMKNENDKAKKEKADKD